MARPFEQWPPVKAIATIVVAAGHALCGTPIALLLGVLPDAALYNFYVRAHFGAFQPFTFVASAALGYVVTRFLRLREAVWAWLPALVWFGVGVWDLANGNRWAWPHLLPAVILDNLLSSKCGDSECLYELFYAAPLFFAVPYSIAALITFKRMRPAPKRDLASS
jgi:hypothetical protein